MTTSDSKSRRPVRMVDIATRAGVSRMAVSAALMGTGNGRIGVSAKTVERIRQIADELGYRPNAAARQLAGKRSGVIAVVANDWKNFLAQRVLAWLHESAQKQGFRILGTQSSGDLKPIEQLLLDSRAGWIDGIVYVAHENESQWPSVSKLLQNNPLAITVGGDLRIPGVTSIVSDVRIGARATMDHLRRIGRRNPVFVTEENESKSIRSRIEAYLQAADERVHFDRNRILVDTRGWLVNNPGHYARFCDLARTVVYDYGADCVLCDTDFTAVGLLRAFHQIGIRVPEEIAVVGWGDLQFSAVFNPRITTVSHDLPALLTQVFTRLQRQLEDPVESGTVDFVQTSLVVRET